MAVLKVQSSLTEFVVEVINRLILKTVSSIFIRFKMNQDRYPLLVLKGWSFGYLKTVIRL